jgi:hypothetical protein
MSQYVVAAPSADAAPKKIESCTQEEEKTQAGMNKIFGSIRSPRYVDSAGKPVQPKLPRRCPPSKAEQDAAMRTIYGNIRSPAYVKGAQTK